MEGFDPEAEELVAGFQIMCRSDRLFISAFGR
jgi:hypothetical protein